MKKQKDLDLLNDNHNLLIDEIIMRQSTEKLFQLKSSAVLPEIEEFHWHCSDPENSFSINLAAAFNENSLESAQIDEYATAESLVLLKNNKLLPISKDTAKKIAVIGPYADNTDLCSPAETLLGSIQSICKKTETIYAQGCTLSGDTAEDESLILEALWAAEQADVVIIAVGSENTNENFLSKTQQELITGVSGVCKNTILLNFTGCSVDLSSADEYCDAIIQCWKPVKFTFAAAAKMIFGLYQPSGKLPITFYKNLISYDKCTINGKNYEHRSGTVLYPFGYGLSYSFIEYYRIYLSESKIKAGDNISVIIFLKNKGKFDIYDTVQTYIKDEQASVDTPVYKLAAYKKVLLPAEKEVKVCLSIQSECMTIAKEDGQKIIEPGRFSVYVGAGQPDDRTAELYKRDCLHIGFLVE